MPNPVELVGGLAIGEGVGAAIADTVLPQLESFRLEQWSNHRDKVLPLDALALLVARSIPTDGTVANDPAMNGISDPRFDLLVQLAREYPQLPLALDLWRRRLAVVDNVRGWLHRAGLSDEIVGQILDGGESNPPPAGGNHGLFWDRLSPQQIALGIVRSIIPDPGLMPVTLDTAGGKVKRYTPSQIDAIEEARESGIDHERLRVMVGEIGLPMSPQQAASALFRDIIQRTDFNRAIVEGDTRPEWGDAILDQAREIPTARDFVQERLRGWVQDPAMYAGTARHGMSQADTDVLLRISGRPISFHQVFIGERRGGTYGVDNTGIDPAFLKSLQESNIRPEWYQLAWAQRHSYPSAFVIRSLAQSGDITPEQTHRILNDIGWPDWLITAVVAKWTGGATTARAPEVSSARTNVLTRIRNAYISQRADEAQARGWLGALDVDQATQDGLVRVWDVAREVPGAGLSRSQLKKAYERLPAQWPRDRVLTELEDLGMEPEEAQTFLDE